MIAHLPMYERPQTAAAHDHFWQAIRAALGEGPEALTRDADVWPIWQSPDLLLSQTCGLPYRSRLHDKVTLVATPDYGLKGCPAGHYRSVFVARRLDADLGLAGLCRGRFAFNEALSQSGWAAPITHLNALGLTPQNLVQSGGHAASAKAVAGGLADLAALDALSWEIIQRYDPWAKELLAVAFTAPTPTLPYITAADRDPEPLRVALQQAITALSPADRAALHLRGICQIDSATYRAVPTPAPPDPGRITPL